MFTIMIRTGKSGCCSSTVFWKIQSPSLWKYRLRLSC
jgi:hypothetical protein